MRKHQHVPCQRRMALFAAIPYFLFKLAAMDIRVACSTTYRTFPAQESLRGIGERPRRVSHRYAFPLRHSPCNEMALTTGEFNVFAPQRESSLFMTETDIPPSVG